MRLKFFVFGILALGAGSLWADTQLKLPDPLEIQPNSVVFSETYRKKSVKAAGASAAALVERDKFSVAASVPYAGPEVGLPSSTLFELRLGNLQVSHVLADDPSYNTNRKKATFVDSFVQTTNGVAATLGERITTIKWKKQKLTVTVIALTKDQSVSEWSSIGAGGLAGTTPGAVANVLNAAVQFNSAGSRFNTVAASGTFALRQTVADDGTTLSLPVVKWQGADATPLAVLPPVHVTAGTDTNVGSAVATNSTGGVITVTTGTLAGTTVTIPPGAVTADTLFTVAQNNAVVVPNAGTFSGLVLNLHSSGQTAFPEPVRITMPFADDGTVTPVPYYIDDDGHLEVCQLVGIDHANHTVSFESFHASLYTLLYAPTSATTGHNSFVPGVNGFKIVNYGNTRYNPEGECFGMAAFALWYFERKPGYLFPRYYEDIPVGDGTTRKGQQIIATRTQTSLSRELSYYNSVAADEQLLNDSDRFSHIANVISNTSKPQIVLLDSHGLLPYLGLLESGRHAVLAFDCSASSLMLYDPNYPGELKVISRSDFSYDGHNRLALIGDGSFQKEAFENIYQDAEAGFRQNGLAQIDVTSLNNGDHVSSRTVEISGQFFSGEVLVDHLEVVLNGTTIFNGDIDEDGGFKVPVSLVAGDNALTFNTTGHDAHENVVQHLNDQRNIFHVFYDTPASVILATLTWDTGNVDLDLYAIDPAGDYSCYYHKITGDGGELDYDNTSGYGPEHWTLGGDDTIRWGEDYNFRVHYFSDHDASNEGEIASAVATPWTVTILLYEGTARATTYTYHGVLAYDDGHSADGPGDSGPSWTEVAIVRPVQDDSPAGNAVPTVRRTTNGKVLITVPVVSATKRGAAKAVGKNLR